MKYKKMFVVVLVVVFILFLVGCNIINNKGMIVMSDFVVKFSESKIKDLVDLNLLDLL